VALCNYAAAASISETTNEKSVTNTHTSQWTRESSSRAEIFLLCLIRLCLVMKMPRGFVPNKKRCHGDAAAATTTTTAAFYYDRGTRSSSGRFFTCMTDCGEIIQLLIYYHNKMNIYVPGGQYSLTTNSNAQSQEWLPCSTDQNRHGGKEMRERKKYAYNKR